jgi:hypothetical protein
MVMNSLVITSSVAGGYPGHHLAREQLPHRVCCHPGYGLRRFLSKEEIIAQLEEYLKQLQAESKGVEERIAEFRKGG